MFDDLALEFGGTVSVTRGIGAPVPLTYVRGKALTRVFTDEGFYGTSHQDDFIFKKQDYIDDVGGEPDVNDYIDWTDDNGTARRFQVAVEGAERQHDPSDGLGLLIRVHTTEVRVP